MIKLYKKIILFFKKPKHITYIGESTSIEEKEVVEKIGVEGSIEVSLGFLKTKNNEFIQTTKNSDYDRNLFLYEIGFTKLKRVREFISTMNQVGNIEDFNIVEKRYSKFKLDILNDEMLNILKREYGFVQESNDKFDDFIPDIAIDTLKTNYMNLDSNRLVFDLYDRYYMDDYPSLVPVDKSENFLKNYYSELKNTLTATQKDKKEVYSSSHYYTIKRKKIHVCYNNTKGMILLEVEPKYYLILCDWTDKDGNKMDKLNFKDFIKTQD